MTTQHTDEMREAFLKQWDKARLLVSGGDDSDLPRMIIENALDEYAQAATASAEGKYLPVIEKLVEKATEAAETIAQCVKVEHGWPNVHPANQRRYDRDMEQVQEILAALALAAPLLRGE